MDIYDRLTGCTGFEWDEYNAGKIWSKHLVSPSECEELFFNRPLAMANDIKHSEAEDRFYALGQTDTGRTLFVVFTIRGALIRIISARNMSRKEKTRYRANEKKNP